MHRRRVRSLCEAGVANSWVAQNLSAMSATFASKPWAAVMQQCRPVRLSRAVVIGLTSYGVIRLGGQLIN